MRRPSGVHDWLVLLPSFVRRVSVPDDDAYTQTSLGPPVSRMPNAIRSPTGDRRGATYRPPPVRIGRATPDRFTTTSWLPVTSTYASVPFGETAISAAP